MNFRWYNIYVLDLGEVCISVPGVIGLKFIGPIYRTLSSSQKDFFSREYFNDKAIQFNKFFML